MSDIAHAERKHAKLSPSKADMWAVCTSSVDFIAANADRVRPDKSSAAADEGTIAHEVAESILTNKPNKMPKKGVTREMMDHGRAYAKFVKSLGGKFEVEQEAPLWYSNTPGEAGHVDCFVHDDGEKHLHVVDYKYGKGVKVNAVKNLQMTTYAAGIIFRDYPKLSDHAKVSLHIYQPRCQKDDGEEAHSTWETTWAELRLFAISRIDIPAEIVQNPKAAHLRKFAPGEKQCQWCPAREICGARAAWLFDGSPVTDYIDKGESNMPEPKTITDAQIVSILRKASQLRSWLEDVADYAKERWSMGNPVSGTKMVAGKGARSWGSNWDDVEKLLLMEGGVPRQLIYSEPQPKSPAQIEELLKQHKIDKEVLGNITKLVNRVSGSPTLAFADNPKPEIPSPAKLFEFEGNLWD